MGNLKKIIGYLFCSVIALPTYSQIHNEKKPEMRRTNSCRDLKKLLEEDPFSNKTFEQSPKQPLASNNNNNSKEEVTELNPASMTQITENSFEKMMKRHDPFRRSVSAPKIAIQEPVIKPYTSKKQQLTRSFSELSSKAYAITYPAQGVFAIHDLDEDKELLTLNGAPWKTHTTFASATNIAYITKPESAVCVVEVPTGKHLKCTDFKVIDYNTSTYEIPQGVSGPELISEGKKPYPITVKGLNNNKLLTLYRSTVTTTNKEKGGLLYLWDVDAGTFTELSPNEVNIELALLAAGKLIDTKGNKIRIVENPGKLTASTKTIVKHSKPISSLSLSRSEFSLASGSADKTVRLWDLAMHGRESATFEFPEKINSIAFHPEIEYLLAVAASGTIHFVDTRSKESIGSSPLGDMCKNNIVRTLKWNQKSLYAEIGLRVWSKLTDLDKFLLSGKNPEPTPQSQ
ncbi:MAG TPA: WD40 repeat domain-containing protein [Candidatus Babeliales bacterium]|nr:WD40 repeat domain-containing protein [Candidatus Babeliales bacterium]